MKKKLNQLIDINSRLFTKKLSTKMELSMRGRLFKDYVMEKENIFGKMEPVMMDNGSKITFKEQGSYILEMDKSIEDNLK